MSEKLVTIKEVVLTNNCPECYSKEGLRLSFKQKIIDTKFYKSITSKISHEITCKTCKMIIYPVKWTDDIERVFEYHKKAFVPKKASTYLKKASWIAIILTSIIIITAITLAVVYPFNL
ncbi:hypothetical protein [Flavivirga rizhaonensis]|uniref:Uncharacterized protein n=1 Tax=Flavivirga rizhaonensis TaxID=2559571 RepID=A0A4S1DY42_9FLAO|nr:hypothetical protein [Flavivirga rizhaonensis]TGV02885.1 hypothetical protein EM932_09220 [Flavivirga rizhaonensis]